MESGHGLLSKLLGRVSSLKLEFGELKHSLEVKAASLQVKYEKIKKITIYEIMPGPASSMK